MPPSSAIRIVIVYETAAVAVRAQEIAEEFAADSQSGCDSWPMELLAVPAVFREAAIAASEAAMIIIAAGDAGEPQHHVRNWIETWLPRKKRGPTALVALVDKEDETLCKPPPFCVYLLQVAERGNMDFFFNPNHWVLPDFHNADQFIPQRETSKLKTISRAEPMSLGCGINDQNSSPIMPISP